MVEAQTVTKSRGIFRSVNKLISGRRTVKHESIEFIQRAVVKGMIQESKMSVVGVGEAYTFDNQQAEAKRYWHDLSGEEVAAKLIKKARAEDMKEFRKHGVYEG